MPVDPVDPGTPEGDALARWYRRSPWQLEEERRAAQARRWQDFAEWANAAPEEGGGGRLGYGDDHLGPDAAAADETSASGSMLSYDPGHEGEFILVGGKMPRLKREWSKKEGQDWPSDPVTGRKYDGHHIVLKADGGQDVVENIQPMHPDEHRALHMENGDFGRLAKRRWRFAGPGEGGLKGLGLLQVIPTITGILSGRIRTDNFENFSSDVMGVPSPQDVRRQREELRRKLYPECPPGLLCV